LLIKALTDKQTLDTERIQRQKDRETEEDKRLRERKTERKKD
jgi:hypothetical protein